MADKYTQGNSQNFEDTINNSIKSLKGLDNQIDKTDRKLGNTSNVFKGLEAQISKVAGKVDSIAKAYKNLSDVDLRKLKDAKIPTIKKEEVTAWENYAQSLKGIATAFKDMKDNMSSVDAKSYNALKNLLTKIDKIDNSTIGRISTIANELNKLGKIDFSFEDNTKTSFNKVISMLKEVRKLSESGAGLDKLNDLLNDTLDTVTDIVNKIEESKGLSALLEHQQIKGTNKQLEKQLELKEKLVDKEKELSDIKEERKKKDNADKLSIKQANDRLQSMKGMLDVAKIESNYSIKSEDIRAKLEEGIAKNPSNKDKLIADSTYKLGVNNADMQMDTNLLNAQNKYNDIIKRLADKRNELIKSDEFTEKEQDKYNRNLERLNAIYKNIIENETNKRNNIVGGLSKARTLQIDQTPKRADTTFINQSATATRANNNRNVRAEEKKLRSDLHSQNILNEMVENSLSASFSKDAKNILLKGLNTRLGGVLRQSETLQTVLTGGKLEEIKNKKIQAKSDYTKAIGNAEYEHEIEKSSIEERRRKSELEVNRKFSLGKITQGQLDAAKQGITNKAAERTQQSVAKLASKKAAAATQQTATLTAAQGEMATVAAGAATSMAVMAAGITAAVVATKLMVDASNKAAKSNESVAKSLLAMGKIDIADAKELTEYSRLLDSIKNKWNNIIVDIGQEFINIFKPALRAVNNAMGGGDGVNTYAGEKSSLSNIQVMANMQGLTDGTSLNISTGIYQIAEKLREKGYETDVNELTSEIADAVFNGNSSAVARYGINVDKDTMTGYKAENDINPYVQYTDAAESSFRYQSLLKQLANGNKESMQDQIKDWKELGTVIEATKNQLFSFDKVITMEPINPYIPEVSQKGVISLKGLEQTEKKLEDIKKYTKDFRKPIEFIVDTRSITQAGSVMQSLIKDLEYWNKMSLVNAGLGGLYKGQGTPLSPDFEKPILNDHGIGNMLNKNNSNRPMLNNTNSGMRNSTTKHSGDVSNGRSGRIRQGIESMDVSNIQNIQNEFSKTGKDWIGNAFNSVKDLFSKPQGSYDTGGIITKDHVAKVHSGELYIPPSGSAATPIFEKIGKGIAESMGGTGGNTEIHMHLGERGVVIKDETALNDFVRVLDSKLTQLKLRRGD